MPLFSLARNAHPLHSLVSALSEVIRGCMLRFSHYLFCPRHHQYLFLHFLAGTLCLLDSLFCRAAIAVIKLAGPPRRRLMMFHGRAGKLLAVTGMAWRVSANTSAKNDSVPSRSFPMARGGLTRIRESSLGGHSQHPRPWWPAACCTDEQCSLQVSRPLSGAESASSAEPAADQDCQNDLLAASGSQEFRVSCLAIVSACARKKACKHRVDRHSGPFATVAAYWRAPRCGWSLPAQHQRSCHAKTRWPPHRPGQQWFHCSGMLPTEHAEGVCPTRGFFVTSADRKLNPLRCRGRCALLPILGTSNLPRDRMCWFMRDGVDFFFCFPRAPFCLRLLVWPPRPESLQPVQSTHEAFRADYFGFPIATAACWAPCTWAAN